MKIQIIIKSAYEERWFLVEETEVTLLEDFYKALDKNGVFWSVEKFKFDEQFIVIYKHKTFGYISAFNTNYRKERFQ